MNKNYKLKELADIGGLESAKPKEPAWIPWEGGKCPLPDEVKRWEYRMRCGKEFTVTDMGKRVEYWSHEGWPGDIVAYRVWPE